MEGHTLASSLKLDPSVLQAKKSLIEALKKKQKKIQGIKPPNPELTKQYQAALEAYEKHRGGALWYPYLGSGFGDGPFVELLDGSIKYDFIGGIGVHHFGHAHLEIINASLDAALSDIVMQGGLQQNHDAVELTDLLIQESKMDHCYLTTSGAMANENAFKIALQKNHPANRILALENNFSGRTWTMAQVGDKPHHREGLPINIPVDYIPFFDPQNPESSIKYAVEILKKTLHRYPHQHALMIFELVQGEGGCIPGSKEYFKALMSLLKDHKVAIIIDEIQTFGRTSRLFAFQHYDLEEYADIVTIGKLSQVCATLYRKEWKPRPGLIAQTFLSSTIAINVGKTIIHSMIKEKFFGSDGKNMQLFQHFSENFESIASRHPGLIKGPYGIGSMIVFTPMDGTMAQVKDVSMKLFQNGLITFIAGAKPSKIRMLVPVGAIEKKDVDIVCNIIEETLCM